MTDLAHLPSLARQGAEVRVIACLDRSSSMVRFEKYAMVAALYPQALVQLRVANPCALVETWWFAREVDCYAVLETPSAAKTPGAREYRQALAGGSAISDCIIGALARAQTLRETRGDAPTRIVVWTDGWNRLARHSTLAVRRAMEERSWVEVFLIGFVDWRVRAKLERFTSEIGLAPERVMVFEHTDDREDTARAASGSSAALGATMSRWS
jgi:hypothetical protein